METLGGFSLVRQLGVGPRAEIWLGHDGGEVVALKVFRPFVQRSDIDIEIEALGRASSRHLLRLRDLASTPDGTPCIVLERLSALNLGQILSRRTLGAGEAVTILAPIALAVAELHRVGVAHSAVRPSAVLFDGVGAPVLASFGSSQLIGDFPDPPESNSLTIEQRAHHPAVAEDLRQLADLVTVVFRGVEDGAELCRWLGTVAPAREVQASREVPAWPDDFADELADRLFTVANPSPVRVTAATTFDSVDAVPSRLGESGSAIPGQEAALSHGSEGGRNAGDTATHRAVVGTLALPTSVEQALTDVHATALRVVASIRPRVWILVGVLAILGVAAASVLVGGTSLFSGTALSGSSKAADHPSTVQSTTVPRPATGGQHERDVTSDDPLAAASALLGLRAHCFAQRSILCLDGVDQANSSAMDADSHAIRLAQQGAVSTGAPGFATAGATLVDVKLVERLGDSVLLSVNLKTDPGAASSEKPAASLLLVKGETGWLIRDLVSADQDGSS
ncbi:MAG: hypothetical protein ABIW81_05730 [Terrimesophilobacter sp.]